MYSSSSGGMGAGGWRSFSIWIFVVDKRDLREEMEGRGFLRSLGLVGFGEEIGEGRYGFTKG